MSMNILYLLKYTKEIKYLPSTSFTQCFNFLKSSNPTRNVFLTQSSNTKKNIHHNEKNLRLNAKKNTNTVSSRFSMYHNGYPIQLISLSVVIYLKMKSCIISRIRTTVFLYNFQEERESKEYNKYQNKKFKLNHTKPIIKFPHPNFLFRV